MDNTGEEIQKKWKSYSNFHNKLGRRTSEVNSKLKITFERRREWVSWGEEENLNHEKNARQRHSRYTGTEIISML